MIMMMTTNKLPKATAQAFEWLAKMGIEVKPLSDTGNDTYQFEYNGVDIWLHTDDVPDNNIVLSCLFCIEPEPSDWKECVFDMAVEMTKKELSNYIIEYVDEGICWIGNEWTISNLPLRKYSLKQMLDEMSEAYNNFFVAIMCFSPPQEVFDEILKDIE